MAVAEITNIIIEKGTEFEATFNLFDSDSSTAYLLGATVIGKIRKYPTSPTSVSFGGPPLSPGGPPLANPVVNVAEGSIKVFLSREQTATLAAGRNYFDIFMTLDNKRTKVIKGSMIVEESVSS